MTCFRCPKCTLPLAETERTLRCPAGHCYDRARSGYVNLLLPGKGASGTHGDDKRMVSARRAFLSAGYYNPLIDKIAQYCAEALPAGGKVLDCGCGEGSYTSAVAHALAARGDGAQVIGVDISKDAVDLAAKRDKSLDLAVASVFHLPLADGSVDAILNLFAPMVPSEYARVLRDGGFVLKATPLPEHLLQLKAAIYDEVYPTEPEPEDWEGFSLIEKQAVTFPMHLPTNEAVHALFEMTPYCYTTPRSGRERLDAIEDLDVTAAFVLAVYRNRMP